MLITSRDNKIYKLLKALNDRKRRESEGLFLIEGVRGVGDAIKNGLEVKYVILCEGSETNIEAPRTYVFAKRLFAEIADTQTPQGVIAAFAMPKAELSDLSGGENSFAVLCENVRDPGNLGTIIRTADAAGAAGAVLNKGCCDLFNPKTVRSTVASIGSLPIVRGADAHEAIKTLRAMGYKIAAGALRGNSVDLYKADLSGKIAFVLGNEGGGISKELLSEADFIVRIPMRGSAESLNVSVAAAIMLYEKVRINSK